MATGPVSGSSNALTGGAKRTSGIPESKDGCVEVKVEGRNLVISHWYQKDVAVSTTTKMVYVTLVSRRLCSIW